MTIRAYYYSVPSGGTFTRGVDGFVTYEADDVKIRTDRQVPKDTDEYIVIDGKNNKAIVYDKAEDAEAFIANSRQSIQFSSITFDGKTVDSMSSRVELKFGAFAQFHKGAYNLMPLTPDQNGQPIEDYDNGLLGDSGRGVILYLRANPLAFIPGLAGVILGHLSTGIRYDYLSNPDIIPQYSNNDPSTFAKMHNLSLSSRAEISLSDFLPDTPVNPMLFAEYDIGTRWTDVFYAKNGEFTPRHSTDSGFNQAWRVGLDVKVNLENIFHANLSAFLPANLRILFFIEGNKPVN